MTKKTLKLYASEIDWDTDGATVDLPSEVEIPIPVSMEYQLQEEDDSVLSDFLSDTFGWCVNSFNIIMK